MPSPSVTIGVLVTRGPDMVGRCLRAIAATREDAPASELVLVRATGDPATAEVVEAEAPDATIIHAPVGLNVGLGPAQNLIFATARGQRVLLLHEDSQPEPEALRELWAAAEARPQAAVVGAQMLGADGALQQAGAVVWRDGRVSTLHGPCGERRAAASEVFPVDASGMAGTLVERAAWAEAGGFDERFFPAFYGDIDLCLAVWALGREVVCAPRAVVHHEREAMVDDARGVTASARMRAFLRERQRAQFREKWALDTFADGGRGAPADEQLDAAGERGAARAAATAGLLRGEQQRPITRVDGADATAIDGEVERRLLRAQVALLRDFADDLAAPSRRAPATERRTTRRPSRTEDVRALLERVPAAAWRHRWPIMPGLETPGAYDVEARLDAVQVPDDINGASVLVVGAIDGALAFEAERRGAARVVVTGVGEAFDPLAEALDSAVVRSDVAMRDLATLDEQFDLVLALDLLHHTLHPVLLLESLRALTGGHLLVDSAVADHELGPAPVAQFHLHDSLAGDPSNWFAPTTQTLVDWCVAVGFDAELIGAWPPDAPAHAAVRAAPRP